MAAVFHFGGTGDSKGTGGGYFSLLPRRCRPRAGRALAGRALASRALM